MIFLQLFYTFLIIGAFTFGGGYSMIALIQDEVVTHHQWLTPQEFADILAISQMTPGPVGINTATYAGYSAVVAEGYPAAMGVAGGVVASLAVLVIPLTLILVVGRWLLKHKDQAPFDVIFRTLRLTVIGLIAAAAIALFVDTFDVDTLIHSRYNLSTAQLINLSTSLLIFAVVFALSVFPKRKVSPIVLILLSGIAGLLVYGLQ